MKIEYEQAIGFFKKFLIFSQESCIFTNDSEASRKYDLKRQVFKFRS